MLSRAYFAYGSNLSTPRLRRRVPSARPRATGFVHGYDVYFCKRGKDGSAKATLTECAGGRAHGCVYWLAVREKRWLDRIEGLGMGYHERMVRVQLQDGEIEAFTYIAALTHLDFSLRPYDWYAGLVHAGAREHGLPRDIIERYRRVETITDPDGRRAAMHWAMLGGHR